ncbi:hypothetical protein V6N13_037397 [Hibiscus sabdariffa]
MDWDAVGQKRLLHLNELEEIQLSAYNSTIIYKEKTKKWHDQRLLPRQSLPGQQVLVFNSRLKLFPGKLKSRWSGPFEITQVAPLGAITLKSLQDGQEFKVNGQRVKPQAAQANLSWVREFYAHNAEGNDAANVRGRRVAANSATINTLLDLPENLPNIYELVDALEDTNFDTIKDQLCIAETKWNTTGKNP